MTWRGDTTPSDRIFAALPYLLVLFDGVLFGESVLRLVPDLAKILTPLLLPLFIIHRTIPFASLIIFFGLFVFVVRNEKIKHFIRFNTMQALFITICLFLIRLIAGLFAGVLMFSLIINVVYTLVFMGVLIVFIYAVIQSLRGEYADLPSISDAVYMQVP